MATKKNGRPRLKECKRGHSLSDKKNVRHTTGFRPTGGKMKEYPIRICLLCEKIRRAAKAKQKKEGK